MRSILTNMFRIMIIVITTLPVIMNVLLAFGIFVTATIVFIGFAVIILITSIILIIWPRCVLGGEFC